MTTPRQPGRPPVPDDARAEGRSITLTAEEWQRLAALDPDGKPQRAAVRIIRQHIKTEPKP